MTRRSGLLRLWRLLALFLALAMVAASCGGDDDDDDAGGDDAADTSEAGVDPEGVLRVATTLAGLNFQEQTQYATPVLLGVMYHVIGTPLQLKPDGTVGGYLAEGYEINDPRTLVLTLRGDEVTFQNGDPYDAATLKAAIEGNRATGNALYDVRITNEISEIVVDSPTQLTFKLKSPIAGQLPLVLAKAAAYAVRPAPAGGFPIGAGPYSIKEFVQENKLVVERWDDFFEADDYLLKGVEYLHIPTIEAAQNALQGDEVDFIATNPRDVDSLLSRGAFEKVVTNNEGHYMLAACKAVAPFDDPKFREAFDLAINREQLNQVVLGGNAKPMTSVWDPSSPYALDMIDADGDTAKAEEILEEIGWDANRSIPFGFFQGFQTHQLIAETLQGQLAKVGIKIDVKPIPPGTQNELVNARTGGAYVIANSNPGVTKVVIPALTAGSAWNACDYDDPELKKLTDQVTAGDATEDEVEDIWAEIQEIVIGEHLFYPLLTQPAVYVYNTDRVQGVKSGTVGLLGATAPSPYLAGISIKAA